MTAIKDVLYSNIEPCDACKNHITGGEWQVCPDCGRKYRSFYIPKLRDIRLTNLKNYSILVWLFLLHVIVLRDVILVSEYQWWDFLISIIGTITIQSLISYYILTNIKPKV